MLAFQKDWVLNGVFPELSLEKWQKTVDIMARIFRAPAGFIVQYRGDQGYQITVASRQESNPYPPGTDIPKETDIFCRDVIRTVAPLYLPNASKKPQWANIPEVADDGFESYLGMPICWPDGTVFGTICVMDFEVTDYEDSFFGLMEQFRDMVESDLMMLDQVRLLQELSIRDDLSGLMNRRGLFIAAEQKLHIAKRHSHPFGVMFLDMDNLKRINDDFGHAAGDLAISAMGQALASVLRDSDLAGRIGGDEFAALLFVNQESDLVSLIERIKKALKHVTEGSATLKNLSASCGYVYYENEPGISFEQMIQLADQAMYKQKTSRRAS